MLLSPERICALYESAENPQGEVLRLAQLCGVRPSEITAILAENAQELPPGMSPDELPPESTQEKVIDAPIRPDVPASRMFGQVSVWTKERVEQLLALRAEGLGRARIAEKMGLDVRQVGNKLQLLKGKDEKRMEKGIVGEYTKSCAEAAQEAVPPEKAEGEAGQARPVGGKTPHVAPVLGLAASEAAPTQQVSLPADSAAATPPVRREEMLAHMEAMEVFARQQLGAVKIIALSANTDAGTARVLFECADASRYQIQMTYFWPEGVYAAG